MVCAAKRGSGSANAMTCTRAMHGAKRGPQERLLPSPDQPHRPAQTQLRLSSHPRGGITRSITHQSHGARPICRIIGR